MQSPVVCPAPPHLTWQKSYTPWMLKSIPGTEKHLSFKLTLCKLCCSWRWVYPDTAKSGGLWRRNSCTGAAGHGVWIILLDKKRKLGRIEWTTWSIRSKRLLTTPSSRRVPFSMASSLNCICLSWFEPSGNCKGDGWESFSQCAE